MLSHDCEVVKICDFGEARTINTVMTAGSGTPLWMAPEVINSKLCDKIFKPSLYQLGVQWTLCVSTSLYPFVLALG